MLLSSRHRALLCSLVFIPAALGQSQAPIYGQCAGDGWTGPTICPSGYVCTFYNAYYSQCLPGSGGTSTSSIPASSTPASSTASPQPTETDPGLATIGKSIGWKYVGSATDGPEGNCTDTNYVKIFQEQFNMATTGVSVNWNTTEPSLGSFNFNIANALVQWAKSNNMMLRGQPLVWYAAVPYWLSQGGYDSSKLTSILNTHILKVVSTFKGQFYAWDVVNEIFNDDGSFRKSIFYTTLGKGFVETAFRAARNADPYAKLYINEDNIETRNAKFEALYTLMKDLKTKNVPVDGVGIQGHFIVGKVDAKALEANLFDLSSFGDVAITELDVRIPSPPSKSDLDQQQKDYQAVFAACKKVKACVGVSIWGLSDKWSWIPSNYAGYGDALPWDDIYNRKPAYQGAVDGMRF